MKKKLLGLVALAMVVLSGCGTYTTHHTTVHHVYHSSPTYHAYHSSSTHHVVIHKKVVHHVVVHHVHH